MAEAIVNIGANTGQATAAVEDLNSALGQTGAASTNASAKTEQLTTKLEKQEATIKILDGAVNLLGGSIELAAGAAIGLGLATEEDTERFEAAALGAIAFAEGAKRTLDGVVNLTEGITKFGGAQKIATAFTTAFGVALKVAMGPVGIAIAAIGLITTAIVLLKDKFEIVNKVAEFFGDIFTKVAEVVGLAATESEKFAEAQGELAKTLDFELKLLKAQGASVDQLVKKERELLTAKVNATKEGSEERIKAEQELAIVEAQAITDREAREPAANDKRKPEEEKRAQERFDILNKELQDREKRLQGYEDAAERIRKAALDKQRQDRLDIADFEAEEDEAAFNAVLVDLEKRKAVGKQRTDDAQKVADAEAAIRDLNTANASAAINALGSLFAEGTAASKAAAIADIAIGTATGFIQGLDIAQKTAKAAGPGAALVFPLFYAAQIAAVLAAANQARQILSTAPGGGGGGGNISKPSIPGTPSLGNAGIGGSALGGGFVEPGTPVVTPSEPIRAYVVTGDVVNGIQAGGQLRRRRTLGPG